MTSEINSIALFTDFGPDDHYLGQMKAVLLTGSPTTPVFDLMNCAPQFIPRAAGRLLAAIVNDLPPDELQTVARTLNKIMTEDIKKDNPWIIVPLEVEFQISKIDGNWYDMKEYTYEEIMEGKVEL